MRPGVRGQARYILPLRSRGRGHVRHSGGPDDLRVQSHLCHTIRQYQPIQEAAGVRTWAMQHRPTWESILVK